MSRREKYYCDFIKCKSLGRCLIPMSGEDCYTLGMTSEIQSRKYEEWLRKFCKNVNNNGREKHK